ncbi:MAG: S-layer homology domain-containing protein [Leptolyngbya sp. SIOISBB]|nr:S-layer homology domain-containing protein [Leptolyngbya sp. SIOISBB]
MVNLPPPEPNEQPPAGQRRDNDEAIAVAIALLSVGAILWWGWTRGQQLFAPVVNLPQLADSGLVEEAAPMALEADGEDSSVQRRDGLGGFFGGLFAGGNGNAGADANAADTITGSRNGNDIDADLNRSDSGSGRPSDSGTGPDSGASATASDAASPGTAVDAQTIPGGEVIPDAADAAAEGTPNGSVSTSPDNPAVDPEPLPELSIADVSEDYWAYPYIVSLFEAGLLPDLPSGELKPDKELTRAELAALLNKSFVGEVPPKRSLTFTDVPGDFWAANDIKQVVEAGYMTGFPEGDFKPDELVPRYQVFITMATGLELPPPEDVEGTINRFQGSQELPAWARSQVAAAASQGLIVNHPDPQQLEPWKPATRADLIAIIHQALVARGELEPVDAPFSVPSE